MMTLNHESAFSGHLGAKKTEVRILPNFFWPGLCQDVIRFWRSCNVCQKTVKRGSVKKVPLESMPLIDTPFKRVAVDIVRPIAPPSEAGHWYILTLIGIINYTLLGLIEHHGVFINSGHYVSYIKITSGTIVMINTLQKLIYLQCQIILILCFMPKRSI